MGDYHFLGDEDTQEIRQAIGNALIPKATDRQYAENHGISLRNFQKLISNAQRKLWRREKLTEDEREAWDFAMGNNKDAAQRVEP